MLSRHDIECAIDLHGDTVWRVCNLYFGQRTDAQDAFQETLLKYATVEKVFNDENHRKAWLIRVATNVCKDMVKAAHRRNVSFDEYEITDALISLDSRNQPDSSLHDVLEAMRSLSDPPRTPIYLALYEGYTAPEISKLLDMPVNTVYSWISRGKERLREVLG